jgi:transposase InsO family protein
VELLKQNGYTVKDACEAPGFSRSSHYVSKQPKEAKECHLALRDTALIERIKAIKAEHPFWGYRRVRAWLLHREKVLVNEKRIRRLMKEHNLMVIQAVYKAKRTPLKSKPRADSPKQYWGIDMTKFLISSLGWIYLVIVLDWFTKRIVGWDISLRSKACDWQRALAPNNEFSEGVRGCGLKLISDNGSQPTSITFMKDMTTLGIEQIFTSYDNPKGNADTERMIRTIKEEVIWVNEFETLEEAKDKIGRWIEIDYNKNYVHSALGYQSPEEFEALYNIENLKEAV